MVQFYYSDAHCGGGKTFWAIQQMAGVEGRYLYAVDRRAVMAGRAGEVEGVAAQVGKVPSVPVIRSSMGDDDKGGTAQVRQALEAAAATYATSRHVVVVVTHEALMSADLRGFGGWTAIIDEAPATLAVGTRRTPALAPWLKANYALKPDPDDPGWSLVEPAGGILPLAHVSEDDTLSGWQGFHKRVLAGHEVYCSVTDWDAVADGRQWTWYAPWRFSNLAAFDEVFVLANAFHSSLSYLVAQKVEPQVRFQPLTITDTRTWARRTATISYFAEAHVASASFWSGEAGGRCLAQVAEWIAKNSDNNHIWTCNAAREGVFGAVPIKGQRLTPRQHGSDDFKHISTASVVYSAKLNPSEVPVFARLGITPEQVQRAREREDILQFSLRTSLRDPASTQPVEIRVYDRQQATFLAEALEATGYVDAVLSPVPTSVLSTTKPKQGRPAANPLKPPVADAERKRAKRAEAREAAIKAGTYRPRGRPKKSA